jgi:pyrimidine-nucleoside phosphorylase
MLASSKEIDLTDARNQVEDAISSGKAYAKFLEWISAQGGDASAVDENRLEVGRYRREIKAERDGYLNALDAESVGYSACLLGAGRITKDDNPDLSAGIVLAKKRYDEVKAGDTLAVLYTSDESKLDSAAEEFSRAVLIDREKSQNPLPLIYKTVR